MLEIAHMSYAFMTYTARVGKSGEAEAVQTTGQQWRVAESATSAITTTSKTYITKSPGRQVKPFSCFLFPLIPCG